MASPTTQQTGYNSAVVIDLGDLSWSSPQRVSDRSPEEVFRDFGLDLIQYRTLQAKIDLTFCEYEKLKNEANWIRAQIYEIQQQHRIFDRLIGDLQKEIAKVEQSIPELKEKEQIAKQACIKSETALDQNPNPGKKPEEKRAAQKWKAKMEAYKKVAPGLRQVHEKNENELKSATQALELAEGKLVWLQEQLCRAQEKKSAQKMEPLSIELSGLELKIQGLRSKKNDLINAFLLTVPLELVQREVRNEIESAFPFD